MTLDLPRFWAEEHKKNDNRWVSSSDPEIILSRLDIYLGGIKSVLEIGPGRMRLANYLSSKVDRVVLHDLVTLDDIRFVPTLPLEVPVELAIAHLVIQHVPNHRELIASVVASLVPGGKFYYDVVTSDFAEPHMDAEFNAGLSFPFDAWDLVNEKREISDGYYFCISERTR